jgi:glycosyltransferase involved in cell wall biosynthesis
VVHVHTLPDFLIAAALPARRQGARLLLDLHEIFPEFTRSKYPGPLGAIGAVVARGLERWSRHQADAVLTVNDPIAALLAGRPARPGESITVVHNSPDPGEFGPRVEPVGDAGPPLRLVYHGTLTPMYGVDIAVAAVAGARKAGLDVRLDIFGDGPAASALASQVRAADLGDTVRLLGSVPAAELRRRLPGYHAGFIPTRADVMTRYSLSTKLLECVHFGLALVLPRLETYLAYFPEAVAWYYTPDVAEDAAAALARLAAAPREGRAARSREAQRAAARLDWARDAEALRAVYRRLLAAQPR